MFTPPPTPTTQHSPRALLTAPHTAVLHYICYNVIITTKFTGRIKSTVGTLLVEYMHLHLSEMENN